VVGPNEIAGVVRDLAASIPDSVSVNLWPHPFYTSDYTFSFKSRFVATFRGPLLLGRLSAVARGFLYVGPNGFLFWGNDYRDYEFRLLKKWGCQIASFQTGSEIRSVKRLKEWGEQLNVETYATVLTDQMSSDELQENETQVLNRARVLDRRADLIFNSEIDQISYLESDFVPVSYFLADETFVTSTTKFDDLSVVRICHAPSNPTIKGTREIRAAIDRLRDEGHELEYRELEGVPHDFVIQHLDDAHIVVNELYSMMPGVFAIEALARKCVLLTSANWEYEPSLRFLGVSPWMITNRTNIYSNLRTCLEGRHLLAKQAEAGQRWARYKASRSANSKVLCQLLSSIPSSPRKSTS